MLETALLCAAQPMQLSEMRKLFGDDEQFDNSALRALLETIPSPRIAPDTEPHRG